MKKKIKSDEKVCKSSMKTIVWIEIENIDIIENGQSTASLTTLFGAIVPVLTRASF